MKKQPIGIFDSGVGGLTVFKEIRKRFPYEDIVYFGDTARVPYGPKSKNTVIEYSIQNARFLLQLDAKIIVIACNTSSAAAVEILRKKFPVPIIGVISPGAQAAAENTKNGRIAVIGTEGTIRSNAYPSEISNFKNNLQIFSKACPLFVPLVEEGWENHHLTREIISEYLGSLIEKKIDTLVLGCTHYPILKKAIAEIVGQTVKLVDSAEVVAKELSKILPPAIDTELGKDNFFVSDNEEKFRKLASGILNKEIKSLVKVKLGESWFLS